MSSSQGFRESNLFGAPIRDLGLKNAGTRLEPVVDEFRKELAQRGIRVVPRFHLSTEWGVPFGTVVIGIPFYLAHPDLTGIVEAQAADLLGSPVAGLAARAQNRLDLAGEINLRLGERRRCGEGRQE